MRFDKVLACVFMTHLEPDGFSNRLLPSKRTCPYCSVVGYINLASDSPYRNRMLYGCKCGARWDVRFGAVNMFVDVMRGSDAVR